MHVMNAKKIGLKITRDVSEQHTLVYYSKQSHFDYLGKCGILRYIQYLRSVSGLIHL